MSAGLQCFDEQGRITVDISDRLTRILGTIKTDMSTGGTVIDGGLSTGQPWFDLRIELYEGYPHSDGSVLYRPEVTITGNQISWTRGVTATLTYGVF